MSRGRHIALIVFLLFFTLRTGAQGNVVVHAPKGLDVLYNKKHTLTKPAVKNDTKHVTQTAAPVTAAAMQPGAKPAPVFLNTYVPPPAPRLTSNMRHEKVIYSGKGFRVQIYYGPDRSKAVKIKSEFMRYYPDVRTYLSYYPPYFRVKVGNYRSRGNALGMLKEANSMYSPCMIVPDIITISTF